MPISVQVLNSIVSHGCFLTECSVEHSVIGIRSRLEKGVQLKVKYQVFLILCSCKASPKILSKKSKSKTLLSEGA